MEIEAVQFTAGIGAEVARWCGGVYRQPANPTLHWVDIPTLEGTMRASIGDWVIKGVQGEFYPCKPAIFASTYTEVAA